MSEELDRTREEIQHLKARIACLEEEQEAMRIAFAQEKQAIVQDLEERTHQTIQRLEIEVERRSRELKYMDEERKELTQEVGRLHMANHKTTEEFGRLHSEIYRLETELGRRVQHVSPTTPRRGDDARETTAAMAMRDDSPVRMARIVPHDKKTAAEVHAELEGAPPKRKPGL